MWQMTVFLPFQLIDIVKTVKFYRGEYGVF